MEELNVKLGVDGKELDPKLKQAGEAFKKFGRDISNTLVNADGSVADFGKSIGRLENQLASFRQGIKDSTNPESLLRLQRAAIATEKRIEMMNAFVRSSGSSAKSAGTQFQGFSRVLQDAAFGPAAIANNLEAAVQDMRILKQTSEATGQSLTKTFIASLSGGGGLNLALGAATLALSLASFGMSAWTRLFPKSADEVDKTKKKTMEYVDTLDDVRKAQLLGTQSAQEELTTLRLLYSQYTNANLPLEQRKKAYKQLQEQYPSYFGNMKFEGTQTDKNKAAYDKLANSILATARAQAARDAIVKKEGVKLENNEKLVDLEMEINAVISKRAPLQQRFNAALKGTGEANDRIVANLRGQLLPLLEEEEELISKRRVLVTENNKIIGSQIQLEQQVNAQIAKGGTLIDTTGDKLDKVTEKTEKLKKTTQEWLDLMFAKGRDKAVAGLGTDSGLTNTNNAQAVIFAQQQAQQLKDAMERNRLLLQESSLAYNEFLVSITSNMANAFSNLFTGILTEGKISFKALVNSILQEFARILGSAIVKKLASLFLNFATGGGAGVFGSIFKFLGGGAGKIPGFANGVENFSGGLAYVHAGEVLTNLAPGTNVIPANQVGKGGGGMAQVFIATSYQRADMIVTSYERGERTLGRVI